MLGEEHPHSLTSMANLVSTYLHQGRWKDPEELLVLVVETTKRVLGEEHPDWKYWYNHLVVKLQDLQTIGPCQDGLPRSGRTTRVPRLLDLLLQCRLRNTYIREAYAEIHGTYVISGGAAPNT